MLSCNHKIEDLEIAVIGGSGFYDIKNSVKKIIIETPFGSPSAQINIAEVNGRLVAFLPRHGENHEFPPHKINYRANMWALKQLGIRRIISTGAVGCLNEDWNIGDIVVCDQFVNKTWNRLDTYYDGPITTHVSVTDPYCTEMRDVLIKTGKELQLRIRERGILLIIEGPRFSTRAENRDWSRAGYDLISMTHYPEVVLAKELQMCYSSLCIITDYANILDKPDKDGVNAGHKEVIETYTRHKNELVKLIEFAIPRMPDARYCSCDATMESARVDEYNDSTSISYMHECKEIKLRYGHNPNQHARWVLARGLNSAIVSFTNEWNTQNKRFSLTDLQNVDTAARVLKYQKQNAVVIVKHALITGAAYGDEPLCDTYMKAYIADKSAARTGTAMLKGRIDTKLAGILASHPYDIIAATEWEPKAKMILDKSNISLKTNLRLFKINNMDTLPTFIGDVTNYLEKYTLNDGSYVEEKPFLSRIRSINDLKAYGKDFANLSSEQKEDLLFAWYLTINCRTNSAVLVKDKHVISVSAGNQDGVSAIELAIYKANTRYAGNSDIKNSIIATDGNFPFEDPAELLAQNGIRIIIMPGGADNDEVIIKKFNSFGICVVFTGERCFCHF